MSLLIVSILKEGHGVPVVITKNGVMLIGCEKVRLTVASSNAMYRI